MRFPNWRWLFRRSAKSNRRRFRFALYETLERREMMAVDGWHNVLQPISVLNEPSQQISPLDVLTIINEVNSPVYSNPTTGRLPDQPPLNTRPPFYDVDCDGYVGPLDALNVINVLNGGPTPIGWRFNTSDANSGSGFVSASTCSPKLNEGGSLKTELAATIVVPNDQSAVHVSFESPAFDTTSFGTIRDAFEIVVTDSNGNPIVLPYQPKLDSNYNWSEEIAPIYGPSLVPGLNQQTQTATINLTGVIAGTSVKVAVRLLNNDRDQNSSVVIRGIEIVPANGPNPQSSVWPAQASRASSSAIAWNRLEDLSGSIVDKYGRTTYTADRQSLITELSIENRGNATAIGDVLAVVDSISDLSVSVVSPDGWLADGRPYFIVSGQALTPGLTSTPSPLRFANPSGQRFTFEIKTLGILHQGEVTFTSDPIREIQSGNTY